jgi:ribosomal protein L24E
MEVAPVEGTPHLETAGGLVWFCSERCRTAFAEHARAG